MTGDHRTNAPHGLSGDLPATQFQRSDGRHVARVDQLKAACSDHFVGAIGGRKGIRFCLENKAHTQNIAHRILEGLI